MGSNQDIPLPRLELPMRTTLLAASALALAIAAPLAHAHKAGDIIVRAGAVTVDPREDSSLLNLDGGNVPGTGATLNSDTQLGSNFADMLADQVAIERLPAAPSPPEVACSAAAAATRSPRLDGQLGEV